MPSSSRVASASSGAPCFSVAAVMAVPRQASPSPKRATSLARDTSRDARLAASVIAS